MKLFKKIADILYYNISKIRIVRLRYLIDLLQVGLISLALPTEKGHAYDKLLKFVPL